MSGICDTCRREPCHMRFDGCKTCDVYEGGETRWQELFGTPERAARTLLRVESSCSNYEVDGIKQSCVTCPLNMNGLEYPKMRCYAYVNEDYDELLEWLRGDAE